MTLGARLKQLRRDLGLSQEALGAQGFVSTPGWIKLENGQRLPSDKLLAALCKWLVEEKHLRAGAAATLNDELLTLKYLGHSSTFVRDLAREHARALPNGAALLAPASTAKPRGGRPALATTAGGAR